MKTHYGIPSGLNLTGAPLVVTEALRFLRQFLDANPSEVIMLVIGNYISDADTEKAFRYAKLFDRLWNVEPGAEWPTLREMTDSRRNIVMFAEFGANQPSWNSSAYGAFQDTPFTFRTPEELLTPGAPGYTGDAVVDGPGDQCLQRAHAPGSGLHDPARPVPQHHRRELL